MLTHAGDYMSQVVSLIPEIKINYSDWSISSDDITITSSSCANVCWQEQIANGKEVMQYKYAALDGAWVLGQGFALAPDTQSDANFNEFGWWTATLSDGSSNFSPAQWINTNYTPRSVSSYTVAFDDKRVEYAVDFKVELFNNTTLLLTDTITGNTQTRLERTLTTTENVNNVKLSITKWSHSGRSAKVSEMTTAVKEVYYSDVIKSMSITEEREIKKANSAPNGNIASNDMSFSIINAERKFDNNNTASKLHNLIRPNCHISAYIGAKLANGTIDRIPIYSGYVKNWSVPEGSLTVSASCKDMIEILNDTTFTNSDIQLNQTFSWWIESVLNDAGLSSNQYNIDATLNGALYVVPVGYFKTAKSHKKSLEELTRGCGAVAYQDRLGVIQVQSITNLSGTVQETFTRSNYITKDNQPVFSSMANRVRIKTSPLILNPTTKDIYTGNSSDPFSIGATTSKTFTIHFNSSPATNQAITIDPAVSGLSITSTNLYGWGASVTITNTGTAKDFTLKATGQVYEVSGENIVEAQDDDSIRQNGTKILEWGDSPWIQNITLGQHLCDNIVSVFSDPTKDVTISLNTGNPAIVLGDRIGVTDLYNTMNYYLTKIQMNYNDGGFSSNYEGRV